MEMTQQREINRVRILLSDEGLHCLCHPPIKAPWPLVTDSSLRFLGHKAPGVVRRLTFLFATADLPLGVEAEPIRSPKRITEKSQKRKI